MTKEALTQGDVVSILDRSGEADTTVDKGIVLTAKNSSQLVVIYTREGNIEEYQRDHYGVSVTGNLISGLISQFRDETEHMMGAENADHLPRNTREDIIRMFLDELADTKDPTSASMDAVVEYAPEEVEDYMGDLADVLLRTQEWMINQI